MEGKSKTLTIQKGVRKQIKSLSRRTSNLSEGGNTWASIYKRDFNSIAKHLAQKTLDPVSIRKTKDQILQLNSKPGLETNTASQNDEALPPIIHGSRPSENNESKSNLLRHSKSSVFGECMDKNLVEQCVRVPPIEPTNGADIDGIRKQAKASLMLSHLVRTCICGTCTCGKCKCDYARNPWFDSKKFLVQESTYQDAHGWKAPSNYRQYKPAPDASISVLTKTQNSIYKTDYQPFLPDHFALTKNFNLEPRNKDNDAGTKHLQAPFPKLSIYKENYPDWENKNQPITIGRPNEGTTDKRIPFFAKVSNREYGAFKLEDAERPFDSKQFGRQQFKNPIGPEIKIALSTNHKEDFKKPDMDATNQSKRSSKEHAHQTEPHFESQFKTSYQNYNFAPPEMCPSRKILIELEKKTMIH